MSQSISKKITMLKPLLFSVMFVFPSLVISGVQSIQQLNFGQVVVTNNNSASRLTVYPSGAIFSDAPIVVIVPGQPGIFLFEGYPPNQDVTIHVQEIGSSTQFDGSSSSEQFSFLPFLSGNSYRFDQFGTLELRVGGSLFTSGSGRYLDGNYFQNYRLTINF